MPRKFPRLRGILLKLLRPSQRQLHIRRKLCNLPPSDPQISIYPLKIQHHLALMCCTLAHTRRIGILTITLIPSISAQIALISISSSALNLILSYEIAPSGNPNRRLTRAVVSRMAQIAPWNPLGNLGESRMAARERPSGRKLGWKTAVCWASALPCTNWGRLEEDCAIIWRG